MKLVASSLYEFEKGQDPKSALGIGQRVKIKSWFDEIFPEERTWGPKKPEYYINDDLTIDVNGSFRSPYMGDIPDFIKFRNVYGDFEITGVEDLSHLDFLPEYVGEDLIFYENGIRLTPKKMKDLGIEVIGREILMSPYQESQREANKRYRSRGPLKDRISHKLSDLGAEETRYGPKYSKGYNLYHALKFIKSKGQEGARYSDITQLIFNLRHPGQGKPWSSGWGVGYFSPKDKSPIGKRADKNEKGRWVINDKGEEYLDEYKEIFED